MARASESMRIQGPQDQPVENEIDVLMRMLPLTDARLLELGCGAADKTREIAERADIAEIVAVEVDEIQHQKNLKLNLPKITFKHYGAEAIAEPDASCDIVVMFKSLHHVPAELMDQSLAEIGRVLKPGGLAYLSEPVFAGDFNEVIRLFHDEERVRQSAFAAIQNAVASGTFELADECFFNNVLVLESFSQFEQGVINVTHTDHHLSDDLLDRVRARFENFSSDAGYAFEVPNRVDLLRKPAG